MMHISETWICQELKFNLNHSAKVLGAYIWLNSDFGQRKLITTIQELVDGTHISDSNVRIGLKSLKRFEFIKIEHKHKTSQYVIEVCLPTQKVEARVDKLFNILKPKFDIYGGK